MSRVSESLVNQKSIYLAIEGHVKSFMQGIQRNVIDLASGIGTLEAMPLPSHFPLITLERPILTLSRFRDPSKLHKKFWINCINLTTMDGVLMVNLAISDKFPEFMVSTFSCLKWSTGDKKKIKLIT